MAKTCNRPFRSNDRPFMIKSLRKAVKTRARLRNRYDGSIIDENWKAFKCSGPPSANQKFLLEIKLLFKPKTFCLKQNLSLRNQIFLSKENVIFKSKDIKSIVLSFSCNYASFYLKLRSSVHSISFRCSTFHVLKMMISL